MLAVARRADRRTPSPQRIAALDRTLDGLREIAVDRTVQRASSRHAEVADGGSDGAHRPPLYDLTVAVAAQRSGLEVLHYIATSSASAKPLGVGDRGSPAAAPRFTVAEQRDQRRSSSARITVASSGCRRRGRWSVRYESRVAETASAF